MPYAVYTTVNRANGADFDMASRNYETHHDLVRGVDEIVTSAIAQTLEANGKQPSSITMIVVPLR